MAGKLKLGVLISGGGTNLQALIDACAGPDYPAEISVVISNEDEAGGLARAQKAGIPALTVAHKNYANRTEFENAVHDALMDHEVQLVCLAGFMRILTADFTAKWEQKMINTHPALLPKFGGKGMYGMHVHEAVIAAGERESGMTIHYVTAGVDEGPIILQRKVPVQSDDTPGTLAARVLREEHIAYVEAVQKIAGTCQIKL